MGANKEPHGGKLRNLYLPPDKAVEMRRRAQDLPEWVLTPRQLDDVELILNGAFSPLEGFLGQPDYRSVVETMRLTNGDLWPIPVVLDVTSAFAEGLAPGTEIVLRDSEGSAVAVMEISDLWLPDPGREAEAVYGTGDPEHPGVYFLLSRINPVYLGGQIVGIDAPTHYDFRHLRLSPEEVRAKFDKLGWRRVVAFHTRSPMHRAQLEITKRAAQEAEANLLIHPTAGQTGPGDFDRFARTRCYESVIGEFPEQTAVLSLLPLSMRLAGPREALWHGIVRKNYGCTHIIIGDNHASPAGDADSKSFYGPTEAQELFSEHETELDISMVPFQKMAYAPARAQYVPFDQADTKTEVKDISRRELVRRLRENLPVPDWFSPPEVVSELRRACPPRQKSGFTVFFTGLSGAGKSTIANALMIKLLELGGRSTTLLDGDIVRKNLSSELSFSKEHRDLNILRIGFVASEITRHGGIAICAPIAPYVETRRAVRETVEACGGFIEVYVATSLETCEARDRKGLYAAARAGKIENFTGINDPYQEPENPEIVVRTEELTPDLAAHRILLKLEAMGFIG